MLKPGPWQKTGSISIVHQPTFWQHLPRQRNVVRLRVFFKGQRPRKELEKFVETSTQKDAHTKNALVSLRVRSVTQKSTGHTSGHTHAPIQCKCKAHRQNLLTISLSFSNDPSLATRTFET